MGSKITYTIKQIAEQNGATPTSVRLWAKKAGFELKRGRGILNLFDNEQVKKILAERSTEWIKARARSAASKK